MTKEDAKDYAKSLTDVQRDVLLLCSTGRSFGYRRLAELTGLEYVEVLGAGHFLQSANLAFVETVRLVNEFNGSAIFLNGRGERVRLAATRLRRRKK